MYAGLHPRTRPLRWALFLVLIAVVVAGTAGPATEAVSTWFGAEYDRLPWYVTRVTALLSYLALTGSVIYGLLLSTKVLDRINHRAVSYTLHQDLSSIGVSLALVHVAVLLIDRSEPFSLAEVVVPFLSPYRPLWVGVGQITMILALTVLLSFYARKRIGQRSWRRVHYLSFLLFAGATVHGLMAGSDTQAPWVYAGYLVMTATVIFLTTYRVVLAVSGRATPRPATPRPAATGPAAKSRAVTTVDGATPVAGSSPASTAR